MDLKKKKGWRYAFAELSKALYLKSCRYSHPRPWGNRHVRRSLARAPHPKVNE